MAEDASVTEGTKWAAYFPSLGPLFKKIGRVLLVGFGAGVLSLMGVLAPHVMHVPLNHFWRSYSRLLRDSDVFYTTFIRVNQSAALLGVLSFIIALRIVLRFRDGDVARWNLNRCAAVLALVVFAASAVHFPARSVYYLYSNALTHPPVPQGANTDYRLYDVHKRFERFARENPERYYPGLSRMDLKHHAFLAKKDWWFEPDLTDPGLPLRVAWEGRFFYYLGYRVRDDANVDAFAQAYRKAMASSEHTEFLSLEPAGLERLGNYSIPSSTPGLPLPPRAWSGIPLLIEAIDPETATTGYVLFCDGHTERITYPGRWPMTEATMNQLRSLVDESLRATGEE